MSATLLIVFREVLEASLIIGIALAATRGVPRRNLWINFGIGGGLAGAVVVAFFAEAIANSLEGLGQEVFNACVLFLAVLMLAWHNIWMARHGREMAMQMNHVGHEIRKGERKLYALMIVVGLAVLREGSEIVLFMYGIAAGGSNAVAMLGGGALGLVAGAAVGAAMYFGLLRIPTRHLFTVTGWLILLLAAGMAAQGASFLAQAGYLPELSPMLWDTSGFLPESSAVGEVLKVLIGYDDRPSGIQLTFYVATIIAIGAGMLTLGRHGTRPSSA